MNKILIGTAVVIVAVGGFFILSGNKTNNTATVNVLSSPLATPTASATTSVSPSAKAGETIVTVTANGFEPRTLTIKVGAKVTWTNKSGETVTVNSDPHPAHTLWPFLNVERFNDGSSASITFDKAGTYTYHNHLNSSQKGTVIVE